MLIWVAADQKLLLGERLFHNKIEALMGSRKNTKNVITPTVCT